MATQSLNFGMKSATQLAFSKNVIRKSDLKEAKSNGTLEMAELFELFTGCCHRKKYSARTRDAYWGWIRRFILFHQKRDPLAMGAAEIRQYLVHLALQGQATASTRSQALSALQFFYREVLNLHFDCVQTAVRVKLPAQLPGSLTADELHRVLSGLSGNYWLMASLLFTAGMPLLECIRLRVRDISMARNEILVRDVKDELTRQVKIPQELQSAMKTQMEMVVQAYSKDMESHWQGAYISERLQIEYPNASKLLAWQYVFAANPIPHDPRDHKIRRYHVDAREIQRVLSKAVSDAGCHNRFSRPSPRMVLTESPVLQAS